MLRWLTPYTKHFFLLFPRVDVRMNEWDESLSHLPFSLRVQWVCTRLAQREERDNYFSSFRMQFKGLLLCVAWRANNEDPSRRRDSILRSIYIVCVVLCVCLSAFPHFLFRSQSEVEDQAILLLQPKVEQTGAIQHLLPQVYIPWVYLLSVVVVVGRGSQCEGMWSAVMWIRCEDFWHPLFAHFLLHIFHPCLNSYPVKRDLEWVIAIQCTHNTQHKEVKEREVRQ